MGMYKGGVMICPKCKALFTQRKKRRCPKCGLGIIFPGEAFFKDELCYIPTLGKVLTAEEVLKEIDSCDSLRKEGGAY